MDSRASTLPHLDLLADPACDGGDGQPGGEGVSAVVEAPARAAPAGLGTRAFAGVEGDPATLRAFAGAPSRA